jgi:hypothetical protein
VIVDYRSIVHVNNSLHEEETTFRGDIAIFDVGLPQLVNTGDLSVHGYFTFGEARPQSALCPQNPEFLAKPVHLLLIDLKPVFSS